MIRELFMYVHCKKAYFSGEEQLIKYDINRMIIVTPHFVVEAVERCGPNVMVCQVATGVKR